MRSLPRAAVHTLALLGWAAWVGGTVIVGAVVAPAAFRADRAFAGEMLPGVFLRVNQVALICSLFLLTDMAWDLFDRAREATRRLSIARLVLLATGIGIVAYLTRVLYPAMEIVRTVDRAAFEAIHDRYELLTHVQLYLLIAVAATWSWERARTSLSARREPAHRPVEREPATGAV